MLDNYARNIKLMGCAVGSKYIQLYCTMNQVIFTESEIKSGKFNQLVKVKLCSSIF